MLVKFIRNIILCIFLTFAATTKAQNFEEPVKIGPIEISIAWCEDLQNLSAFLTAFSNFNFPVTGVPGVAFGFVAENNVVLEYCSFLARLKGLSLQEASLLTLEFGNRQTGNKLDEEYELTKSILDIKDAFFDENGQRRGDVKLRAQSIATTLNRSIRTISDYSDNNFGTTFDLRTRQEREAEMAKVTQVAYRRAKIQDILTCPAPKFVDPELDDIWEKQVRPLEEDIRILEAKVDFFYNALLSMGIKFLDSDEIDKYNRDTYNLMTKTYRYVPQTLTAQVKTEKQVQRDLPGDAPVTEDKTEFVEATVNKTYQVFCRGKNDPNKLDERCTFDTIQEYQTQYITNYSKKWDGYVASQVVQNTYGIFDGASRQEKPYIDNSILCNRGQIMERFDQNQPDFYDRVQEEYDRCVVMMQQEIRQSGGLFVFYVSQLLKDQEELMRAQASIWTFESYHFGFFRTLSTQENNDPAGPFEQETVQCAPIENLALLQQKTAEMMATNAEINQLLVEQSFKQYNLMQEQERKRIAEEEEYKRQRRIQDEIDRRKKLPYAGQVTFPDIERGF